MHLLSLRGGMRRVINQYSHIRLELYVWYHAWINFSVRSLVNSILKPIFD